jgi:glycosyltransferase involved in cell wall biosynthesis
MNLPADNPLVSVVLPTHNRAALVKRAILSVLAQTYENFELLVVNDASTDDTAEVLATVKDPRLRVFNCEVNKGAAAARNLGIASGKGEMFSFHDDDDIWFPHKLERQVTALQNASPDTGWCLCGFVCRAGNRCHYVGGKHYYEQLDFKEGIARGNQGPDWSLIATPCWLVRRESLDRSGPFDERIRSWDDWELGLRLDQVCQRVFVDEPLFMQDLVEGGGLTRAERARVNDLRIILDKHGAMWSKRPKVLARNYLFIGRMESLHLNSKIGRKALFQSLRYQPLRLKTWICLMLTLIDSKQNQRLTSWIRTTKISFERFRS